ncbi:MAG: PepSY domain-containing protein [Methylococcales bacterium]|jgi:uncharacterized membrane protein YkoI|nr:PepSY domain-containing protein [Methylococcales bacterium]MBT7442384.1 PepSY domain-containing protein [Methylococcales bacterium]
MNNKKSWQFFWLSAVLIFSLLSTTSAANKNWFNSSSGTSLESAISQVKTQHGGRVLSASTYTVNGKKQHHVKLLSTGRVKTYKIDALTGKQLNSNQRRPTDAYPNNRR